MVSTGNYSNNAVFTFVLLEAFSVTEYRKEIETRSCHAKRVARPWGKFSLNLLAGPPPEIMLRLQIFLTYLKIFLKYLIFRRNVRSDKSEL